MLTDGTLLEWQQVTEIDSATLHVRYSGPLEPHQQKPGDARTTDCRVFYGR